MSDQPTTPPAPDAQPPAQPPQSAQPPAPKPDPVPYERFQEVNRGYQELKAKFDQLEAEKKSAAEAKLKEDGKLQELLATRERELAEERATRLRLSVAAKKGLVGDLAPLAERLRGATEQELEADADTLLALAKRPGGLGVPPAGAGGKPQSVDLKAMTPAQIRDARAKGLLK